MNFSSNLVWLFDSELTASLESYVAYHLAIANIAAIFSYSLSGSSSLIVRIVQV